MNRLFLDTNFLLDQFGSGRPEFAAARTLAQHMKDNDVRGAISPHSLTDFDYIPSKEPKAGRLIALTAFVDWYEVIRLDGYLIRTAIGSGERDFEDGVVRACAEAWDADYIISNDKKTYKESFIERLSPSEYLQREGIAY
ncbi:MAG: PIN domain-containing protein [Bifidobacteriaceae bacterium]|jgi:predicted nucleic acid-binding protein|nr:PIN domain-containing protein [Bifidobacteriaceae bacterium]